MAVLCISTCINVLVIYLPSYLFAINQQGCVLYISSRMRMSGLICSKSEKMYQPQHGREHHIHSISWTARYSAKRTPSDNMCPLQLQ